MQTNNAHEYTDAQLQAAIDAAFPAGARPEGFNLDNRPSSIDWKLEAPNRLAIARAFLAALPKPSHCVDPDQKADPYARLKSYAAAGARIRCTTYGDGWTDWELKKHAAWRWCKPVDQYEVHPDDLHMVPEYAPRAAPWALPAPPPGRRWHREDWTADLLPEGYRPLLDGEVIETGDEFLALLSAIPEWTSYPLSDDTDDGSNASIGHPCDSVFFHHRTRRPLPAEASAEPEEAEVGINGLTDAQTQATASVSGLYKPADNSPPWIPHDGKGCPLKDEEVEEWGFKFRSGDTVEKATDAPSSYTWVHDGDDWWGDKVAYRVLRWKPGNGPQAAQYYMPKLPNPLAQPEPATFEVHGKTLTRHTPGDPCPCDPSALVYVAFKDGTFSSGPDFAEVWGWGTVLTENEWIIGWRYADEPAKPTQSQQAWTPKPGDVVRLKSGGPEMTVCCLTPEGATGCVWFNDGGCLDTKAFPAACLTQPRRASHE